MSDFADIADVFFNGRPSANRHKMDALIAENAKFKEALERIAGVGPLGVDTYEKCFEVMRDYALDALSRMKDEK